MRNHFALPTSLPGYALLVTHYVNSTTSHHPKNTTITAVIAKYTSDSSNRNFQLNAIS